MQENQPYQLNISSSKGFYFGMLRFFGDSGFRTQQEIRTLRRLVLGSDFSFLAPQVRLELTTTRLTAECSTIELLRNAPSSGKCYYTQTVLRCQQDKT